MARKKGAIYPSDIRKRDNYRRTAKKASTRAKLLSPPPPPAPARAARAPAPAPRAASSPAPPALDLIAEETAQLELDDAAGTCPSCKAPHGDHDRNCARCGSPLRRACPKCKAPTETGVRFCTLCGCEVPELGARGGAPPSPPSTALEFAPQVFDPAWEPGDVTFFAAAVDLMLVRMGAPTMSDKERARIDTRTCTLANKYFRPGGRWKDEILWAGAWVPALITAAYIRWVVAPAREREATDAKQQPPSQQQRTAPNLETVK